MSLQRRRIRGFAVAFQIGRRRDDDTVVAPQPPGDEARILQEAGADRHVDSFFDDIGHSIVQRQFHLDLRIKPVERRQQGYQVMQAEMDGRVDA